MIVKFMILLQYITVYAIINTINGNVNLRKNIEVEDEQIYVE